VEEQRSGSNDEASLTAHTGAAWGSWAARRWAAGRAPSGWVVLALLLGLPVALVLAVVLL
jgi:hypothetical protein